MHCIRAVSYTHLDVYKRQVKEDPGTDKMREIADAIAEGANAFLASEYRILVVFVAVLFFVIGFGTRNWITAGCFLVGSGFSTMAGYLGMNAAIRANSRTANAARDVYKRHLKLLPLYHLHRQIADGRGLRGSRVNGLYCGLRRQAV